MPKTHLAIERFAVRRAARTWVFNAAAADRLASASTRVRAGRNWYDDEIFRPAVHPDAPRPLTVGWVGRLETPKGPLEAVEVFAELSRGDVPFKGWFAGSGTLQERVESSVAQHLLSDHVTFHGTLTPAALADELRRTDVLLVSSLWEGQPRAVLEALGCGVPVVTTDVGDVPMILVEGQSGFVARKGTIRELEAELTHRAGALRDRRAIAATIASFRARVRSSERTSRTSRLFRAAARLTSGLKKPSDLRGRSSSGALVRYQCPLRSPRKTSVTVLKISCRSLASDQVVTYR